MKHRQFTSGHIRRENSSSFPLTSINCPWLFRDGWCLMFPSLIVMGFWHIHLVKGLCRSLQFLRAQGHKGFVLIIRECSTTFHPFLLPLSFVLLPLPKCSEVQRGWIDDSCFQHFDKLKFSTINNFKNNRFWPTLTASLIYRHDNNTKETIWEGASLLSHHQ